MEQQIKARFNNTILQQAMQPYGIAENQINELDGFENFIYEFKRDSGEYILRIVHSSRRSEALIQGEVDWINYLADGGTPVARAILSENGKVVEAIDDGYGEHFLATAFVKVNGKPPWEVEETPDLFERYGQLLGQMHALSKAYQPAAPAWRPHWDDALMQDVAQNLPASEAVALEKYRSTFNYVNTLPKDNDSYGLIHFDANDTNLLIDETGNITLFDFDDCNYSWFIYDIAIVLFHKTAISEDKAAHTEEFMPHFLRGYRGENQLDVQWLKEIPHFLKLREIDLYAAIHRSFDVDNIDDWWCAQYMRNRKYNIEHDIPYIDFDFESLAQ